MEIKHRVEGHSPKNAHMLTIRDAEERYSGDPKHERLKREINGVSKETFTDLLGIDGDPFQIVMKNRPYHSIDEILEKNSTINSQIFEKIEEHFWCIN